MKSALLWLLVPGLVVGCGDDDGMPPEDGGVDAGTAVRAHFAPEADPMPWGAVPWPDDLYLDDDGHVALGSYPNETQTAIPEYPEALREGMQDLDGFGLVSPVYFPIEGDVDPASLPQTSADSLLDESAAFLIDADPGSPTALERIPVDVVWMPERQIVAVRPAHGHPLAPGGRYAAVLTDGVRVSDGSSLAPSIAFAGLRDSDARPEDPVLGEAHERYQAVLASLASDGLARESVVALAVFRTQSIADDLDRVRTQIWEDDAPTVSFDEALSGAELDARLGTPAEALDGIGVEGGIRHDQIGWLVHGTFEAPSYLDDQPGVHGAFERDGERIRIKRTDTVPFSVALPAAASTEAVPLVVFQHGITIDRSDMLGVANVLCGAGYAVIGIDAPFHGLRSNLGSLDTENRFTGEEAPDGFGDKRGAQVIVDFAGLTDIQGDLVDFHPFYFRDAMRQATADLLMTVRVARGSDWSAIEALDADLASLRFSDEPVAFVGNSLGGIIGTMFVAVEPEVGAAVLAVTGGSVLNLVSDSPSFNGAYLPQLFPLMGLDVESIDYVNLHPSFYPEVGLWQTLFDRGDSINYGARIARGSANVLMLMAIDDETLPNVGTESLARAIDLPMLDSTPRYVDVATDAMPLRGNVMAGGESLTRGLAVYEPAAHGLLYYRDGEQAWEHPVAPPFVAVDPPLPIANPVEAAQTQMLGFFETWRSGAAEIN